MMIEEVTKVEIILIVTRRSEIRGPIIDFTITNNMHIAIIINAIPNRYE